MCSGRGEVVESVCAVGEGSWCECVQWERGGGGVCVQWERGVGVSVCSGGGGDGVSMCSGRWEVVERVCAKGEGETHIPAPAMGDSTSSSLSSLRLRISFSFSRRTIFSRSSGVYASAHPSPPPPRSGWSNEGEGGTPSGVSCGGWWAWWEWEANIANAAWMKKGGEGINNQGKRLNWWTRLILLPPPAVGVPGICIDSTSRSLLTCCSGKEPLNCWLLHAQLYCTAALYSCTAQLHCTAALYSCTAQLHCTAALHSCTVQHSCTAQLHCTAALHSCTAQLHCTAALHSCTAQLHCTAVLHSCTAQLHCTAALHSCTAQLHCTAALHSCTAQLHCTAALHSCTAQRCIQLTASSERSDSAAWVLSSPSWEAWRRAEASSFNLHSSSVCLSIRQYISV